MAKCWPVEATTALSGYGAAGEAGACLCGRDALSCKRAKRAQPETDPFLPRQDFEAVAATPRPRAGGCIDSLSPQRISAREREWRRDLEAVGGSGVGKGGKGKSLCAFTAALLPPRQHFPADGHQSDPGLTPNTKVPLLFYAAPASAAVSPTLSPPSVTTCSRARALSLSLFQANNPEQQNLTTLIRRSLEAWPRSNKNEPMSAAPHYIKGLERKMRARTRLATGETRRRMHRRPVSEKLQGDPPTKSLNCLFSCPLDPTPYIRRHRPPPSSTAATARTF